MCWPVKKLTIKPTKIAGRPLKDPLAQFAKLHAALMDEKKRIEARLAQINKVIAS
jgi:hypothetical protein